MGKALVIRDMPLKRLLTIKSVTVILLIAPVLVFIIIFYFMPVFLTFAMAFTDMDYRFQWNFVGFVNFQRMIRDPLITKILFNTLFYVFT
ncbi:MAG TPA: sugar ABC transporter permease, partial [Acidilobales archaeon]|nr:sugar ABC transporter permease [Acidilobales archaeon]